MKSVLDIKEVKSTFNVQFVLSLKWKDPRITYQNLKEEDFMNKINLDEFEKIWRPVILFYNTEHRDKTKVNQKHVKTGNLNEFFYFWSPFSQCQKRLLIKTSKNKICPKQVDSDSSIIVQRHSGYTTSPLAMLHNNHFFDGTQNDISIVRDYMTTFLCDFDMQWYPFDIQKCNMSFILQANLCQTKEKL